MPGPGGVLIGVGAVALTGGVAAGYFGALAVGYSVLLAGTGAVSLVGGAIAPCLMSRYAIRGTVTFANGASSPVTVRLEGGKSCQVSVEAPSYAFTGLSTGSYLVSVSSAEHHRFDVASRQVAVAASDADGIDFTVTFRPATQVQWTVTSPITYGTALGPAAFNASLVRTDTQQPVPGTATYTYASGKPLNKGKHIIDAGKVLQPGVIVPAGTHNLQVDFEVDEASFRPPEPSTVKLVVDQALPVVMFRSDVVKQYLEGVSQSDVLVSATFKKKKVEGHCEIPEGKLPGPHTLEVKFRPDDNQNFKVVTGQVPIRIDKRQLKIEWKTPAAINYGTSLGKNQLNASLEPFVSGLIRYSPTWGTVPKGGVCDLKANYDISTSQQELYLPPQEKIVRLTVMPVAPTVEAFPAQLELNPGPLLAQHIKTSARFNSANVPGVFTYTPGLDTALATGSHDVTVGFTPADPATFLSSATAVVKLGVVLVTAEQRKGLGIKANTEQHILFGDVDTVTGTLSGAHSPDIPNLPGYETRNPVVRDSGARDMEVRASYGAENADWTAWKASTLPPANWNNDKLWDATRQTLTTPASRVQDPATNRWSYEADIPNPGHDAVRWKVIRTPADDTVITSYPLR